jgi:hypothetical protein
MAKQDDVEKMHAYTGKTLPMAYTHIHIHVIGGEREKRGGLCI